MQLLTHDGWHAELESDEHLTDVRAGNKTVGAEAEVDRDIGGHNNVRPKPFNAPDADIVDAEIINKQYVNEKKPFIYTQNSENNSENPERFFSAQENSFNFSKSAPFSQTTTANIAQSYVSDRSFSGSTKYGSSSGSFSSFGSSNKELAQVGRQLAFSA